MILFNVFLKKNVSGSSTFTADMLGSLGICFASNINDTDFSSLSSSDIVNQIAYFKGGNFQPNQATSDIFTQKLNSYINTNVTTQSAREDAIFNTLQDASLFLSNLSQLVSNVIYFVS